MTEEELEEEPFKSSKIFYFGSGTLFHETAQKTTDKAIHFARKYQCVIAFDTNIRLKRWESKDRCRETILSYLTRADLVKMSEDELLFLTETNTIEQGLQKVQDWAIPFLFVTMGKEGAFVMHDGKRITVPGIKVDVVDSTGAGDAFFATILYYFHENGFPKDNTQLEDYTKRANQAGALSTTKRGSL